MMVLWCFDFPSHCVVTYSTALESAMGGVIQDTCGLGEAAVLWMLCGAQEEELVGHLELGVVEDHAGGQEGLGLPQEVQEEEQGGHLESGVAAVHWREQEGQG